MLIENELVWTPCDFICAAFSNGGATALRRAVTLSMGARSGEADRWWELNNHRQVQVLHWRTRYLCKP